MHRGREDIQPPETKEGFQHSRKTGSTRCDGTIGFGDQDYLETQANVEVEYPGTQPGKALCMSETWCKSSKTGEYIHRCGVIWAESVRFLKYGDLPLRLKSGGRPRGIKI